MVRRALRLLSLTAGLVGGLSCGREVTGPTDGARLTARGFAFAVEFGPLSAANGVASALVPFERVRVTLDNAANLRAVDRTINFPSTSDSVALSLDVPLTQGTDAEGEFMVLRLAFVNAAGDTVFRSLPQSVRVVPTSAGQPPTQVPTVQVVPVGPAADAASVLVSPQSVDVLSGDSFTFTAQARDAEGQPLSGVPIGWISLDTALARIPVLTSGEGTTRPGRGTARIVAVLPGGQSDAVTVAIAPRPSLIEIFSGNAQTGVAGVELAQSLVVRVRATDGLPMADARVVFAASDGGVVSADTSVTDGNGLAAVGWRLGGSAGAQSLTATLAGVSGSSVTFTATATVVTATQLAFTVQPTSLAAGGTISPAVVVTAQDVNGTTATTFSGAVTIALGSNPGGSTLGGTLTVNAVAGVATFVGLSLDVVGAGYTLTAAAAGLTGATSSSFAVTTGVIAWTNPAGGSWSVPTNWSLGRVPAPADSVVIALAGTYTVVLDTTFTAAFITVGGVTGAQTLSLTNRTLTMSGALSTQGTGRIATNNAVLAGAGTLVNAVTGIVSLRSSSVALAVQNAGVIEARVNVTIGGALTTASTSVLSVAAEGFSTNGNLTVTDGFTNLGTIRLDFVNTPGGQTTTFAVTNGVLVNAVGGVIEATTFSPGAVRFLNAQLVNEGSVQLHSAFTHTARGAGNNTGSIVADSLTTVTLAFSGATPTFTNAGSIVVPTGRSWTTTNAGTFTMAAGSAFSGGGSYTSNTGATTVFEMAPSLSSVGSSGGTLTINSGVVIAGGAMPLASATVNGAGSVVLPVGSSSTWRSSTVAVPVQLDGSLDTRVVTTLSGALTTASTSVLSVAAEGFSTNGNLTVTDGFTNLGTIRLDFVNTPGGQTTTFAVTNGVLVNAVGGVIEATAFSPGAVRFLNAQLVNEGSVQLHSAFTHTARGAGSNTGSIVADSLTTVTLAFSGATPTFTNAGSIVVPTGRSWTTTNAGTFTMAAGSTFSGGGSYTSNTGAITVWEMVPTLSSVGASGGTLTINSGIVISAGAMPLASATVNGAGSVVLPVGSTSTWRSSTVAVPVQLEGALDARQAVTLNGALTTASTSVLSVSAEGFSTNGNLTITDGFTNLGTIKLDFVNTPGGQTSTFAVTNGALVNAVGGVIEATAFSPSAVRFLNAQLVNEGSVQLNAATTINAAAASANAGSITIGATGSLGLVLTGPTPTFSHTGSITIPTGRSWTTSGTGIVTMTAASTVGGGGSYTSNSGATTVWAMAPALSSVGASGGTLTISSGVVISAGAMPLASATVNGAGSVVLPVGSSSTWRSSTVAVPVQLEGALDARQVVTLSGALTTASTSVLSVSAEGFSTNGNLTIVDGFTNLGTIKLDFVNTPGGQTTTFAVTNGALVNAVGGVIEATAFSPAAMRFLNAQLVNEGSVQLHSAFTHTARGAGSNTGSIVADSLTTVTLAFSGATPSFTNAGSIVVPTGRSWTTTNAGTFTMATGSTFSGGGSYTSNTGATTVFEMAPALSSVESSGGTLTINSGVVLAAGAMLLANATVNGAGSVVLPVGSASAWRSSTVAVPVQLDGTLDTREATSLSGALTTSTTAILRVTAEGFSTNANFVVANGFTNNGLIELDFLNTGGQTTRLEVTNGVLLNAAGGVIRTTATTPTAQRQLVASLDNQGSIVIDAVSTFTTSGASVNAGSIAIGATGSLGLVLSGITPTFTHTGSITIPTGRSWTTSGTGIVTMTAGSAVDGGGSYTSNTGATTVWEIAPALSSVGSSGGTLTIDTDVVISGGAMPLASATVNGAGSVVLPVGSASAWRSSTVAVPVQLDGTLDTREATSLSGALTTSSTAILRVTAEGFQSNANFVITNGFTNNGLIELDFVNTGGQTTRLEVTNGVLVNAAGAVIRTTATTPTAARFLVASLDNQGTLDLYPGTAGTLTHTGSLVSTGTIASSVGGLTAGSQYGRINVSGTAVVGGTLTVGLFGAFTPTTGNSFDVINSVGGLSGSFATATLNGVAITPTILANAVRVIAP